MNMLAGLTAKTKRLLGLKPPGRQVAVFPDDTFLVSYPKSGNTWTRFLVANLLYPQRAAEFSSLNEAIPGIDVVSQRAIARQLRPRILKSHYSFDPRYPRLIYIVRDPRDVAVSQFHFHRKRKVISDQIAIEQFVETFVTTGGPYGSWGDHVASWLAPRYGRPGFLLLRYEEMVQDTPRELAKIASFLGVDAGRDQLLRAAERSSADNMRKLEKAQAQSFSATRGTRQDIPFVRAAASGGWQSTLPADCVAGIEDAWGNLMQWLGYNLAFRQKAGADSNVLGSLLGLRTG